MILGIRHKFFLDLSATQNFITDLCSSLDYCVWLATILDSFETFFFFFFLRDQNNFTNKSIRNNAQFTSFEQVISNECCCFGGFLWLVYQLPVHTIFFCFCFFLVSRLSNKSWYYQWVVSIWDSFEWFYLQISSNAKYFSSLI